MIENSVNFIFLLTVLILVVIISKFCKDGGERSCVFLLQGDMGAWVVLLEISLAPASHGAGFFCPGPSAPGNVLVLVVNFVSIRSWTRACSQAPQPEATPRCCWGWAQPVSRPGGPVPERTCRVPAAPGLGADPLPSPLGRFSPQDGGFARAPGRSLHAVPALPGEQARESHHPLAALGMGHGSARDPAPHLHGSGQTQGWSTTCTRGPVLFYIYIQPAWVEIGKMSF